MLNSFIKLNSSLLNSHKITRQQLKAIVSDNVALITIIDNDKQYLGSVKVKLSLSK
ncbi:hypothetical protein [Mycoplasma yeatsii]|uniref:hypothetical protein n=1 Tax=Mycoplasma yeatsii TaxID=51365 RepID=UPI000AA8BC57|nr:hypothetical protein [Mycoplasma yeatsii]